MKLSKKAVPILRVLHRLNEHYGKRYSFAAQKTILKHLKELCFHTICRRQLNYDLRAIENSGLIRRIRRHRRTLSRGMEFRSSIYEITRPGYRLMVGFKMITWGWFKGLMNTDHQKVAKKEKPCAINPWTHDFSRKNEDLTPLFADSG